ncbi:ATP-dependent helicase, partial [Streptomyces sp. NPDC019396]
VPQTTQVRSGEEALSRITGAQAPSGIPVTITTPVSERRTRSASSSRGRRGPASAARRVTVRQSSSGAAAPGRA